MPKFSATLTMPKEHHDEQANAMRPVAMPESWFPGSRRAIIGGELGSEPAEYAVEPDPDYGIRATTLIQLDPDETAKIHETGYLLLTFWGGELPWNIRPAPHLNLDHDQHNDQGAS